MTETQVKKEGIIDLLNPGFDPHKGQIDSIESMMTLLTEQFDEECLEEACEVINHVRQGGSLSESCQFAGITEARFWQIKDAFPPVDRAFHAAQEVRVQLVEDSLFKLACGYNFKKIKKTCSRDPNTGLLYNQKVVTEDVHIKPDATSAIFWLKNRKNEKWKGDGQLGHNVNITHRNELAMEVTVKQVISGMSEEELDRLDGTCNNFIESIESARCLEAPDQPGESAPES